MSSETGSESAAEIATGRIQVGRAAIEANVRAGDRNTPTSRPKADSTESFAGAAVGDSVTRDGPKPKPGYGAPAGALRRRTLSANAARDSISAGGSESVGMPSTRTFFHSRMSAIALWYADTDLR